VPFTAQRSDAGDYIVTYHLDAEAVGYEPFEVLMNIGDNPNDAAPPPGLISIERFLNDAGNAHRFATHPGDITDGWNSDGNHHWWVCP
jgi:hypothetical protein